MAYERRRSVRIAGGWQARYTIDNQRHDGEYRCRVVNVSPGGAALELFGPVPAKGAPIKLEILVASVSSDILHFVAQAIYMGPSTVTSTGMRVGVEWHELTRQQAALLNSLLRRAYQRAS